MQQVIERLRASKAKAANEDYQRGHERGQRWARAGAGAHELAKLDKCRDETIKCADWYEFFSPGEYFEDGAAAFMVAIEACRSSDRKAIGEFWRNVLGRPPSSDFARGFAGGALSVWDEVKDQL